MPRPMRSVVRTTFAAAQLLLLGMALLGLRSPLEILLGVVVVLLLLMNPAPFRRDASRAQWTEARAVPRPAPRQGLEHTSTA